MSTPARKPGGTGIPGILKGLATTARTLATPSHTAEYPDVPPSLPPRSRGVIALLEENCTSCMLCARECPDWCIYIDSHKETIPAATPGGRERQRNVLDRFAIDFSLCMYCGICIEVCPFDALHWSPEFEYSELDIRDLLHEKDRLGEWMPTVPPPPALDEHSAEPAEVAATQKPARGASRLVPRERPARVRPARVGDESPSGAAGTTPAEAQAAEAQATPPTPDEGQAAEVQATPPTPDEGQAAEAQATPPTPDEGQAAEAQATPPTPDEAGGDGA